MCKYLSFISAILLVYFCFSSCESTYVDIAQSEEESTNVEYTNDPFASLEKYVKFDNNEFSFTLNRDEALKKGISAEMYNLWEEELCIRNERVREVTAKGGQYLYYNMIDSTSYNYLKPIDPDTVAKIKSRIISRQTNPNSTGRDAYGWGPEAGQLIYPGWPVDTLYIQKGWNSILIQFDQIVYDGDMNIVNIYGLGYFFEITGTYSNGNPAVICAEIPSDAMGKSVFVAIAGVMGDQSKPHIIKFWTRYYGSRSSVRFGPALCSWWLV